MSFEHSSVSFEALGGIAVVAASDPDGLSSAHTAVRETVAAFDLVCSRFRPDSELSAVNAAAGSPVQLSPLLFDALQAALRAAWLTDGDVDPTVGSSLLALGYDHDFSELSDPELRSRAISFVPVPGWQAIELDPQTRTLRLPRGVSLDLGATAKALAADRAAAAAAAVAGCGVLIGLSGDIAIGGPSPGNGWRVRVTDDHRAGVEAPGQWISLRSGGLATSSTSVRRWSMGEAIANHLVDPATGRSVESVWRTVSVCAASCLDANIASTASIIRGDEAARWLEAAGLPSRLVGRNGVARHVAGWPSDGDDLTAPRHPTPVFAGASL